MSYTRGTSTITTENLVYHLDIPNPLCYHSNQLKCYSLVGQTIGEVSNNLSTTAEGKNSLVFNGSDCYIDLNENLTFTNQQSIEVWVKVDGIGHNYQRILDKSDGNNALNGYALIYHPTLNMIYYVVNDSTTKDMVACAVPSNQWVNIIATKDNNMYKIYVNGKLKNQNTGNSNFSLTNINLRIGAYTQSQERNFTGKINNIKIYNKALTSKEVNVNYEALKRRFIN